MVALGFESFSLRTAVREARQVKEPSTWVAFIRHSKSAELPVVLLEDVGRAIGLVIALFGIVLAKVTDEPRFDAIGSIGIGFLLVMIALVLASRDAQPPRRRGGDAARRATRWRRCIDGRPPGRRLLDVRTQQLGPDEMLVGVELELDPTLSGVELTDALKRSRGTFAPWSRPRSRSTSNPTRPTAM